MLTITRRKRILIGGPSLKNQSIREERSSLKNCIERLCVKGESSFLNKLDKMIVHKGGTFLS